MRAVANRPELKGMGTTVVAALFDGERATLVHVGDSRAYLFRDGELRRLTDDHSWVQEQVNAGILSEDEAKSHPLKNVVTRALGGSPHVSVDLIEVPLREGDRFLLCSDGLTGMVPDEEIHGFLLTETAAESVVRRLVDLANERGGVDNITAIVIDVVGDGAKDERRADALDAQARLREDDDADEEGRIAEGRLRRLTGADLSGRWRPASLEEGRRVGAHRRREELRGVVPVPVRREVAPVRRAEEAPAGEDDDAPCPSPTG